MTHAFGIVDEDQRNIAGHIDAGIAIPAKAAFDNAVAHEHERRIADLDARRERGCADHEFRADGVGACAIGAAH